MLSVIIVDFRSIDRTIDYIRELETKICVSSKIHVIIVDMYSEMDSSVAKLVHRFGEKKTSLLGKKIFQFSDDNADVVYVFGGGNLGYARGNNLGVRIGECLFNDDYLLISNNDIILQTPLNFSEIESIFISDGSIGVIGPQIVGKDGKPQSPCKYFSPLKGLIFRYWLYAGLSRFLGTDLDLDYSDENKFCYRVMGSFMFIRKKAFKEVCGFDENTFLYYEEPILSERMMRKGYKTYFHNGYTVMHNHGNTTKKIADKLILLKYEFSAGLHYYKRYRKSSPFIIVLAKINFAVFEIVFFLKKLIKKVIKTDGKL